MKVHKWDFELSFESDLGLKSFIEDGIHNGFRIVDEGAVVEPYNCSNYKSVYGEAFDFLDELIKGELAEGKFVVADIRPRCVHALGVVPKSNGSYRPITDCSRPSGVSINNFMNVTHQEFKYVSIDEACEEIVPGDFICSVDLSSAYRSINIRPDNWQYQGIRWRLEDKEVYLYDTRLSFGLKSAPYIFTQISKFIENCMKRRGFRRIFSYLDDYLVIGSDFDSCQWAQQTLIELLGSLGFRINWAKCSSPARKKCFFGGAN